MRKKKIGKSSVDRRFHVSLEYILSWIDFIIFVLKILSTKIIFQLLKFRSFKNIHNFNAGDYFKKYSLNQNNYYFQKRQLF